MTPLDGVRGRETAKGVVASLPGVDDRDAAEARRLVPDGVGVTVATDWASGMAASLRAGLVALADGDADQALVHLVDLPDVGLALENRRIDVNANLGNPKAPKGDCQGKTP